MLVFPYSSPIILNDSLFLQYGGQTGTTSLAQRNAAYLIAETQMSNHLGTFLLPIIVTGTVNYHPGLSFVSTDYGMVHRLLSVDVTNKDSSVLYTVSGSNYRYAFISEDGYGYLKVVDFFAQCGGCGSAGPQKFRIVYEAGLPTGTANHPSLLLGLVMAAQINLNEMIFPSANEGVGDIGIQSFGSVEYSEKRKELKNTVFGNSAKANKIAQLADQSGIHKYRKALVL